MFLDHLLPLYVIIQRYDDRWKWLWLMIHCRRRRMKQSCLEFGNLCPVVVSDNLAQCRMRKYRFSPSLSLSPHWILSLIFGYTVGKLPFDDHAPFDGAEGAAKGETQVDQYAHAGGAYTLNSRHSMYVEVAVRRPQVVFVDEDWCYWMGGAHGMDNVQGSDEHESINKGLNFLVVNLIRWWTCRMQVYWAIDRERGGACGSVLPIHLLYTGRWRWVVTKGCPWSWWRCRGWLTR